MYLKDLDVLVKMYHHLKGIGYLYRLQDQVPDMYQKEVYYFMIPKRYKL